MVSKVDGKTSAAQVADADVAKKTPLDDGEKKKGMALLKYDLMKKELVPTKVLFAVVLSSIGVLLPYMTIHMKSLGITVAETAIIYGVYPIFAIFAPFSMGVIADKLGNFKVLLCGMFILTGINGMVFLAIPAGRFHQVYAANISLALGCSEPTDDGTRLSLTDLDSTHCQWEVDARENVTLTTTRCGYLCYQEPGALVLKQAAAAVDWSVEKHQPTRLGRAIFFAGDWTLNVACGAQGCRLQKSDTTTANLTLDQVTLRLNHTVANVFPVEQMMHNNRLINGLQCASFDQPVRLNPAIVYDVDRRVSGAEDAAGVVYESCRSQCIVQTQRSALCANQHDTVEFNPQLTFWVYLVMRISYAILLSGVMVLFEGACLAVVIECKGDLGLQRMFGILGTMIFSPVSGALIDYYSQGQPTTDFRPAFYLYGALSALAAVMMFAIDLDFKPPAENLFKDIKVLLRNVELMVFFVVNFMSGLFWGYIESYLFWFLEDMGGTKSLMGLTLTLSAISGIPVLILSDRIFRKIGHPNVQIIGFLVYVIRLVGYSFIYEPYMCLIFEFMEAITTALMTTSAVAYSADLGTTKTLATIQGVVAGTYYGMGRGAGSFIGGFLMKDYGTRSAFRILGVAAFCTAVFYFLFNQLYIRPKNRRLQQEKKALDHVQLDNDVIDQKGIENLAFSAEKPIQF